MPRQVLDGDAHPAVSHHAEEEATVRREHESVREGPVAGASHQVAARPPSAARGWRAAGDEGPGAGAKAGGGSAPLQDDARRGRDVAGGRAGEATGRGASGAGEGGAGVAGGARSREGARHHAAREPADVAAGGQSGRGAAATGRGRDG